MMVLVEGMLEKETAARGETGFSVAHEETEGTGETLVPVVHAWRAKVTGVEFVCKARPGQRQEAIEDRKMAPYLRYQEKICCATGVTSSPSLRCRGACVHF
jgi:hypothetical protein